MTGKITHQDAERSSRGLVTQGVRPKTEPRRTASLTALQFHVQMRHKNISNMSNLIHIVKLEFDIHRTVHSDIFL
jgi:hypothetical protein